MGHSYNSGATSRKSTGSLSMMAGGGRSSTISSHLNGEKRDSPQLQHARLVLYFVSWSLAPEKLEGPMEFSRLWKKTKKESEIAQLCPTLCDPMDCSLPGFSVLGIFLARILKWVYFSSFSSSSWPKDRTSISCVSWIAGGFFTTEPHYRGFPYNNTIKCSKYNIFFLSK